MIPEGGGESAKFINRELSWLEFNRRVLEEALDDSQPLVERVKFLGIFSSNLDEFFEIRVAGIQQLIESGSEEAGPDGLAPVEILAKIRAVVRPMVEEQYRHWNDVLAPALEREGISLLFAGDLPPADADWVAGYFRDQLFPVLTPLAIDASHPLPQVLNKSHNLIVRMRREGGGEAIHAIVQVPRIAPRLVPLPRGEGDPWRYLRLSDIIRHHAAEMFPGLRVELAHVFRVTRNSDLYIDDDEAENLLRTIEQELRKANRGRAVRLEVGADCPDDLAGYLLAQFHLEAGDLYRLPGPISMTHLDAIVGNEAFAHLKDRPFSPARDPMLPAGADLWELLRGQDVMLHHPYESFDTIVELLQAAADDADVLAIKMTLYRTSGDSPVVAALIAAARNGKQVTALVEIKARFDEAANIQWGRQLEEAGVHVVYGVIGFKTHCKMMLIVRREGDRLRQYVHLGTGNYHPRTARIYTDLSLLTAHPEITREVGVVFNTITGPAEFRGVPHLLVAPYDLADRFVAMIGRERDHALAGRDAGIVVKVNSLVDERAIRALYEASSAGVKIDLIVRGICCLRPGLPGTSERIRVISIVGRFLEHSRVMYFKNGGAPELYLGSADWMPRNFYRRVEVAFPVLDPALREEIAGDILPAFLSDCVKSRELMSDGTYRRVRPEPGHPPKQAQLYFREKARQAIRLAETQAQRAGPATGAGP